MTLPGLTQATLGFEVHTVPEILIDNLFSSGAQKDRKKGRGESPSSKSIQPSVWSGQTHGTTIPRKSKTNVIKEHAAVKQKA